MAGKTCLRHVFNQVKMAEAHIERAQAATDLIALIYPTNKLSTTPICEIG
jgi:hypothetical protein